MRTAHSREPECSPGSERERKSTVTLINAPVATSFLAKRIRVTTCVDKRSDLEARHIVCSLLLAMDQSRCLRVKRTPKTNSDLRPRGDYHRAFSPTPQHSTAAHKQQYMIDAAHAVFCTPHMGARATIWRAMRPR